MAASSVESGVVIVAVALIVLHDCRKLIRRAATTDLLAEATPARMPETA
jgi:hypothetical protein